MLKQPKRTNPITTLPNAYSLNDGSFKQQPFKAESPRFGSIPLKTDPSFNNASQRDQHSDKSYNRRKVELVFLKLENHLNKMAFYLGDKLRLIKLSDGFVAIKQKRQIAKPTLHNYASIVLKSKVQGLVRVLRNKARLVMQAAFVKVTAVCGEKRDFGALRTNSRCGAGKTYETHQNKSAILTELERKGDIPDFDRRTMKPSKKSALQSDPSKRTLEAIYKQNQNIDNMSNLELQNRNLRKQITKQERQQANFVEMMSDLLDQYEVSVNDDSSTSRPNLTSLCSSPDQFKTRSKNSLADKNKVFKDRRY